MNVKQCTTQRDNLVAKREHSTRKWSIKLTHNSNYTRVHKLKESRTFCTPHAVGAAKTTASTQWRPGH